MKSVERFVYWMVSIGSYPKYYPERRSQWNYFARINQIRAFVLLIQKSSKRISYDYQAAEGCKTNVIVDGEFYVCWQRLMES